MIIIGAGMAGLLCGVMNPNATILDGAKEPVDTHQALLRFRTNRIEKITGIPLREVKVQKAVWSDGAETAMTLGMANSYSLKVTGTISARSIIDTQPVTRYIPPTTFMRDLRTIAPPVKYGCPVKKIQTAQLVVGGARVMIRTERPVISTIPMPQLASIMRVSDPAPFSTKSISVTQMTIADCDLHATMYYPDISTSVYRASLNGNVLIIEGMLPISIDDVRMVLQSFGIPLENTNSDITNTTQPIGKLTPISPDARKRFILDMTLDHDIYSLGRFATWRPKVMLDDVVDDIYQIRNLITSGNYVAKSYQQQEE